MVAPLRLVMLCSPEAAGWTAEERRARWEELGYLRMPDPVQARQEHEELCAALKAAGCELFFLTASADLTMDAVYAHDASLMTAFGAVCFRMGKEARASEPQLHRSFYAEAGIPVLGELVPPGTAEAGDIVWLDKATLMVGRGFRTNASGIEQLRGLLSPQGVSVLEAPLPYGAGPATCLHLMSLMSMLDERSVLVDLPLLSVETVEFLLNRGLRLIEIDYEERATLACNVLALGKGKLIALEQNPRTNQRLRDLGYQVATFSGTEIGINGGGGPTCLTRPLLRGT
jgi:N-dimethylarginine dimethylaminohydrolase